MSDKPESLFKEFPPVSLQEWEKVIESDLRGADYKQKLKWHTGEGIDSLPFYRRESLMGLERHNPISKLAAKENRNGWDIRELISENSIPAANKAARRAISRGADSLQISMTLRRAEGTLGGDLQGVPLQCQQDLDQLLQEIDPEQVALHFDAGIASPALLAILWNKSQAEGLDHQKLSGTFSYDPFVFLLGSGYYPKKKEDLESDIAQLGRFTVDHFPRLRTLGVDARYYHNAGATIVQQLAYALSAASEYLSILTDSGLEPGTAARCLSLSFATGSSYFLEIAKIRAARILWRNLLDAYGAKDESPAYIHGETSTWNKTLYDPYTNMLRTSTEAMSAAIGGCDTITVNPFDAHFRKPDTFSTRIARNQQIILEEEAYLDKVSDPSAGSYYIEKLTDALGEEAWTLFQEIETEGGLFKAIENGTVQSAIQESQQERDRQIANRKRIFVGTNQYSNPEEGSEDIRTSSPSTVSLETTGASFTMEEGEEESIVEFLSKAFSKGARMGELVDQLFDYQKQEFRTVHPYRGSLPFEALRQATEQHAGTPTVLTLPLGNRKMRKARAAFASNFFGSAGYHIEEPIGFDSVDEALKSIKKSKPDVVVLCSSDEQYKELVAELCNQLQQIEDQPIAVLAGDPGEREDVYRKAGIDAFIHTGSNVLETLRYFQRELGIISNDN